MERTNLIKITCVPFLRLFMSLVFIASACNMMAHQTETTYLASHAVDEHTKYEVIAKKVNVRAAASTTSTVVGTLNAGDIVEVKSVQNGWARLSFHGKDCYVKANFLKVVATKEAKPNNASSQHSAKQEAQAKPRQAAAEPRKSPAAQPRPAQRKGKKQDDFKGWHPFAEVQPIIVCAKGAKPRFDLLGGVTKGLNNYISVGGGTGLSTDFNSPLVVPLFARLTIQNKELNLTPLFLFDAGYDFNLKHIKASAIRLNPTLGIKTGGLYIGVGYMAAIPTMKDADMVHNVNFKLGWEFDANSKNSKFAKDTKRFFTHSVPNFLKKTYVEVEVGAGLGLRTERTYEGTSERIGNNYHLQLAWNYRAKENWDIGIGTGYRKYTFNNDMEDEDWKIQGIPIFLRNQYYLTPEAQDFRPFIGVDLGVSRFRLKAVEYDESQYGPGQYEDIVYKQHSTNFLFRPRIGVIYKNKVSAALSLTQTSVTITQEDAAEGEDPKKATNSLPSLDLTVGVRLW